MLIVPISDTIDLSLSLIWGQAVGTGAITSSVTYATCFFRQPHERVNAADFIRSAPEARVCGSVLGREPEGSSRGAETDVLAVGALSAEVDLSCPLCPGRPRPRNLNEAIAAMRSAAPSATAMIKSGHGPHPIWSLVRPVGAAEGKALALALQDRLASAWQAHGWAPLDAAGTSIVRLLKLPGALSCKPGHEPHRCELLGPAGQPCHSIGESLYWPTYTGEELARALGIDLRVEAAAIETQIAAQGRVCPPQGGGRKKGMGELPLFAAPLTVEQRRLARALHRHNVRLVGLGQRHRREACVKFFSALRDAGLTLGQAARWLDGLVQDVNANRPEKAPLERAEAEATATSRGPTPTVCSGTHESRSPLAHQSYARTGSLLTADESMQGQAIPTRGSLRPLRRRQPSRPVNVMTVEQQAREALAAAVVVAMAAATATTQTHQAKVGAIDGDRRTDRLPHHAYSPSPRLQSTSAALRRRSAAT